MKLRVSQAFRLRISRAALHSCRDLCLIECICCLVTDAWSAWGGTLARRSGPAPRLGLLPLSAGAAVGASVRALIGLTTSAAPANVAPFELFGLQGGGLLRAIFPLSETLP